MIKVLTFFVLLSIAQSVMAENKCVDYFDSERDTFMWPPAATQQVRNFKLSAETSIDLGSAPQREYGINEEVEGSHYARLFTSIYRGHRVFAKVSQIRTDGMNTGDRTLQDFANEVAWAQRLDQLGIGPAFFGFSTTGEGNYVIITEFIEGTHVGLTPGMDAMLSRNFKFRPGLIESLRKIQQIVSEQGIVLKNLDLRITESQAFVIDPEEFRVADDPSEVAASGELIESFIRQLLKRK